MITNPETGHDHNDAGHGAGAIGPLADLQLSTHRKQMPTHLLTRPIGITPTKHVQQRPMPLHRSPGGCRTAAVTVVNGLHPAQAGEGGLQYPVPGCLGDCVVESQCELIELVRLVNQLFRLINKLLEPIPLFDLRTCSGEGGHCRFD